MLSGPSGESFFLREKKESCSGQIFLFPVIRRNAVNGFEGAGKIQGIGIAYGSGDFPDGQVRVEQQVRGFAHPVKDEKLMGVRFIFSLNSLPR